jgi:catechol 2,3-dioxygenase-like lactoylglutathione lyase family enzyme
MTSSLRYVLLYSRCLPSAVRFYERGLGLQVLHQDERFGFFFFFFFFFFLFFLNPGHVPFSCVDLKAFRSFSPCPMHLHLSPRQQNRTTGHWFQ